VVTEPNDGEAPPVSTDCAAAAADSSRGIVAAKVISTILRFPIWSPSETPLEGCGGIWPVKMMDVIISFINMTAVI
jgi:hypothetical protein